MIWLALALLLDSPVDQAFPEPPLEEERRVIEQMLEQIRTENRALSARAVADAEVFRQVRSVESTLGDMREAALQSALDEVRKIRAGHEAVASAETVAALQKTEVALQQAIEQRSRPMFGREAFHHMVTDVVSEVVRRNSVDLLDRLLLLRRLHGVVGNAIEEMEKTTLESLK